MTTVILLVMMFAIPAGAFFLFLLVCRWLWRVGSRAGQP